MITMMHKELFAAYLEAVHREKTSIYRKIAGMVPKELSYNIDGKELSARELLLTKDIEGADLVASEFYNTVLEGANPWRAVREAVPFYKMNSDVLNVPYGASVTESITPIAEGAEVPVAVNNYAKATFTAKKYGLRPLITSELIDDSKYDVISNNVAFVGQRLELGLNKLMIDELVTDATATAGDCGNAGVNKLTAISDAANNVDTAGFKADTILMCPKLYGDLRASIATTGTYAYNEVGSVLRSGNVGTLYGLKVYQSAHTPASATNWKFAADNDVGAIVFDSKMCGGVGMRKDLSVEQYKDPIRDLVGCTVLMRYDVQAFIGGSIATVIY